MFLNNSGDATRDVPMVSAGGNLMETATLPPLAIVARQALVQAATSSPQSFIGGIAAEMVNAKSNKERWAALNILAYTIKKVRAA
jgi:hypothetical protein